MYKAILLLLFSSCISTLSFGQRSSLPSFSPRLLPAPTTAALERYALMPVNEPAGTPSISIPLYEVRSGSLSLPITLSYHASGIRVTDVASWAGLGWSLNAGGAITRSVRGVADEAPEGYASVAHQVPQFRDVSLPKDENFLSRITQNQLDYQPDLYMFNALGQVGSFMLGNDKRFHMLPLQPMRIVQLDSGFVLTNAEGITYRFQNPEISNVTGRNATSYINAWYLTQVVSADRVDTLRLEYERHSTASSSVHQQQSFVASISDPDGLDKSPIEAFTETTTYTNQHSCKLRRIHFRGGMVEVEMERGRRDVPDDRRLVSLTVLRRGSQDTVKYIRLYHSYFGPATSVSEWAKLSRLRLDSVITRAPGQKMPPYKFTYNTQVLPHRMKGARDHWGYYNGAPLMNSPDNTPLFIAQQQVYTFYHGLMTYKGVDREPNPAFVQSGLLTQITYPTGGSQILRYEPNTVASNYEIPNPRQTISVSGQGPGHTSDESPCREFTQSFTVSETVTAERFRLLCSQIIDSRYPTHHNKVLLTITDITPGYTPKTVMRTSALFGKSTTWKEEGKIEVV